jgi:hypothetical protein
MGEADEAEPPTKSEGNGSAEANPTGGDENSKTDNGGEAAKKPGDEDATKQGGASAGVGDVDDEKTPPTPVANLPILVGTLACSDRDGLRRHIIRGNWKYENSHETPPQRFELLRTIPEGEDLEELPKDGEFNGSFNVQHFVKSSKGKMKIKNRAVAENGVMLKFTPEDEEEDKFAVKGKGSNEYGVFELFGTATKNKVEEDEDRDEDDDAAVPTYSVTVHKRYTGEPPAPPAEAGSSQGSKDNKRKFGETEGEENEELPPPAELPTEGVCLVGKLVRNTSDELSLDNAAVHRITGLWSMGGPSKIRDDPTLCEKFEYEHKCSGDSAVFPLSGRYTGFFYVNEAGERTKIAERDVTLKFRPNSEGYHNVEGRGSNIFGKYSITGTLQKDGTITLFRHFQAVKVKPSKRSTQVKISAPRANGSTSRASPKADDGGAAPLQPAHLSFEDVNVPDEEGPVPPLTPPLQFTALSRGILKIENDGTHTCSGVWAMTNDDFASSLTSKYHFGITAHDAAGDAKAMLDRMGEDNEEDDRRIRGVPEDGLNPVTLAHKTFPIDSVQYKGSFKMRKGLSGSRTQTIVDRQIVLRFVKNTSGSFNVYGKGSNEMGTFDLMGTLLLQGKTNGLMQLYRMYPQVAAPQTVVGTATNKSTKVFRGSLTEKPSADSGPVPAMKPPEHFIPSMSGLQRRESSRMSRLPSRLEEDDPEAQMERYMDQCRQILRELQNADQQNIFAVPVDPVALGIQTYFEFIKDPMDLGTIHQKMEGGEVETPEEFARLVRLTFENAITYNTDPGNVVHVLARNLMGKFNSKFGTIDKAYAAAKKNRKLTKAERQELKRKEKEAAKEAKRRAREEKERKRKAEIEASNESKRMKLENVVAANRNTMAAIARAAPEDPEANMTRAEYNLLVEAIRHVQEQIVGLHKLVKKSSKAGNGPASSALSTASGAALDTSTSHASSAPLLSAAPVSKPKKKKQKKEPEPEPEPEPTPSPKNFPTQAPTAEEELQPLSFQEQEALSEDINLLPERLLPGAMQIIRESDFVNDDDDEVDLDLDQLDTRTQRKLQAFVMENVKTKKKKKQSKKPKQSSAPAAHPAPAPNPPSPPPSPAEEDEPKKSPDAETSRPPGGKSFFPFPDDDDSDDDKDDDEEEDLKMATNWVVNPPSKDAAEEGAGADSAAKVDGDDNSDKDDEDEDDLWGAARKEAESAKAREADRAKREEKVRAEAEIAAQRRMAEAAALGEEARARREEEEAAEAKLREEQEREAEEARKAAREKALQEVNSVRTTVDIGDAQRDLMRQYEQEFNDNYSAGASPSSDFGF